MIKLIAVALVLWISMYSLLWVTSTLYNNGYDIFGRWNKKRRK